MVTAVRNDTSLVHDASEAHPSVLVVDDEPSIRDFLAFVLEDEGFRVSTAGNGEEALHVAEAEQPDVVLTDLMMPRMDGYEFIRRLRRAPIATPAIIAMSAVQAASRAPIGADLFLSKPFEIEQVLAGVQALLSSSSPR